jgi:hypothetical protein
LILNPRSQERIFLLRKIIPAGSFVETDDATANRSEQRFLFRDSKWPIVWLVRINVPLLGNPFMSNSPVIRESLGKI